MNCRYKLNVDIIICLIAYFDMHIVLIDYPLGFANRFYELI